MRIKLILIGINVYTKYIPIGMKPHPVLELQIEGLYSAVATR